MEWFVALAGLALFGALAWILREPPEGRAFHLSLDARSEVRWEEADQLLSIGGVVFRLTPHQLVLPDGTRWNLHQIRDLCAMNTRVWLVTEDGPFPIGSCSAADLLVDEALAPVREAIIERQRVPDPVERTEMERALSDMRERG